MNETNDITATLVAVKNAGLQSLALSDAPIAQVLSDIADAAEQTIPFLLEAADTVAHPFLLREARLRS